jgi:hypothetical protein
VTTVALRTSLIWHDEVMDDLVIDRPKKITLGRTGSSTFTVPDIGLPKNFAIVRPGKRGYLLTLGERMRGTICVDGEQRDVGEFVARGEGQRVGSFCATPISGRDWGVIDLDESGHYKLFFQFVPVEEPAVFFTPQVILAGIIGYLVTGAALALLWWLRSYDIDEAAFRGGGMATVVLALAAIGYYIYCLEPESQAALAFSIILHGALLGWLYWTWVDEDPFVWPGARGITGNYLVTRLEPEKPPEPVKPTLGAAKQEKQEAAAKNQNKPHPKAATKGAEGAAGGKGEKERARDPNAKDVPVETPKVALTDDKSVKMIDNVLNHDLDTALGKFTGLKGDTRTKGFTGFGNGEGTGVGAGKGFGTKKGSKGKGSGANGGVEGDVVSAGKIDTGADRPGGNCVGPNCTGAGPKEIKLAIQGGSGDFGGYTQDEIDRVVRGAQGLLRACYQRELNHAPGLGGKLVIRWRIGPEGTVQTAANGGGSSLVNDAVESCVKRNIMKLRFPPKGAIANVTYPFVFTQGV